MCCMTLKHHKMKPKVMAKQLVLIIRSFAMDLRISGKSESVKKYSTKSICSIHIQKFGYNHKFVFLDRETP